MGDTTAAGGRDDAIRRLFACFPEGHPLWPDVERFRRWVEAHDRYHELKQDDAGAAFSEIKRRIRARVKDGQWKLKALEVWMAPVRRATEGVPQVTWFSFSAATGEYSTFDIFSDPALPGIPRLLNPADAWNGRAFRLLRYMPGQRFTFSVTGRLTTGIAEVGKLMRVGVARQAHSKLGLIRQKVGRAGFQVAEPTGLDHEGSLYYQSLLPGRPVKEILEPGNFLEMIAEIGRLHTRLHSLEVPGLPSWDEAQHWDSLDSRFALLAALLPDCAETLSVLREALTRGRGQAVGPRRGLCHGDLNVSQLLLQGDTWCIIDFDNAVMGEPMQETARFLTRLLASQRLRDFSNRTPAPGANLARQAEAAYLEGYCEASQGSWREQGFIWHRICAEIDAAAHAFRADIFEPDVVGARLEAAREMARRLGEGRS